MNMTQRILQFAGPMVVGLLIAASVTAHAAWRQWGHDPQHSNFTNAQGQALDRNIVDIVYDPFVAQEQAEQEGDLLTHYQAPLTEGNAVFMAFQTGTWLPCDPPASWVDPTVHCGPNAWETKIWNEKRLDWEHGTLRERWNFASDWKPEPNGGAAGLGGWEPVFHPILGNLFFVYVPGASGTMFKVNKFNGDMITRINPFDGMDPNTYVSGMPVADNRGNIYYNVIQLAAAPNPWSVDVVDAWLIKVDFFDRVSKVRYRDLIPDAPTMCIGSFSPALLPWPSAPEAQPALIPCGAQRPGVNVGPAIARDGTIYTLSRTHLSSFYSYVVAVNPNLTPKWVASLRDRLHNGCNNDTGDFPGSTLPANGTAGGCRLGAIPGRDPQNNQLPAGRVIDQSSSIPVVAPDGAVLYGAYTRYNYARGNLFKFDADGHFVASYDFGWDQTPGIDKTNSPYSIAIKDNHYEVGSYCNNPTFCPPAPNGPYFITKLNADLSVRWQFQSYNTLSCQRNPDGTLTCVDDHPGGFEWCTNALTIDRDGTTYANSEDGNLYAILNDGTERDHIFQQLALGAAYTPMTVGGNGLIYSQNDGHLFVVGH